MKFAAPTDTNTGSFLREPGIYHFVVINVNEQPTNKDGSLLDAIDINCEVLDGTVQSDGACTEVGKTTDLKLWNPDLSRDDRGERAAKIQMKFFEAVGLLDANDRGREVEFELSDAVGRQFIATLEQTKDSKYLQLPYSGDIYHVDDSAVKQIPKDKAALGLIPASQRKISGKPVSSGNGAAKKKSKVKKETAVADTADVPSMDDI